VPPQHDDEPLYRSQIDWRLFTRLLAIARPHAGALGAAIALLILVSGAELLFPLLMKIGIDRYIRTKDTAGLLRLSLAYLALLAAVFALRYAQMHATQALGQKIMFDLRRRLYRHTQTLSISYFERNPVGRIMTRLTGDVEALNDLFTSGVVSIFGDLLLIAGIVTAMLMLDVRLALVCFLVVPLLAVATFLFRARVREAYTTIRAKVAAMNAYLQEHLSGIAVVQLFRREEASARQFGRLNAEHRDAFLKSVQAFSVYFPVVGLLDAIAVALILGYGGSRVLDATLSIGSLVAFFQYSERFFRPIRDLSERYNVLQGALASAERVFELLDTEPEIRSPEGARQSSGIPLVGAGEIVLDHVRFGYKREEPVLHDLSLRVSPGEAVALVGHTGAGKTTIASLLVRFYDVWGGMISIDGVDVRRWDLGALRRGIAVVPQDVFLFSGSAIRNIGLRDPSIGPESVERAIDVVRARDFLSALPEGLETELRERGNILSVGQKQLLAFARALARDPRILVLDEATSSVDTQAELRIREALRRLTHGRTSIIIAHRLSTIRHVDRVLVLHKGRLAEEGTHADLLSRGGIYSKLYDLEFRQQEEESGETAAEGAD